MVRSKRTSRPALPPVERVEPSGVPPIQFTVAVVGVIPDTAESREKIRDVVESALNRAGVAVKFLFAKYETLSGELIAVHNSGKPSAAPEANRAPGGGDGDVG